MATNDNRAMVEAAREFITKHRSRYPPLMDNSQQYRAMADFAALAVAAERTRIVGDMMALYAKSESMTEFGEEAHAYLYAADAQ